MSGIDQTFFEEEVRREFLYAQYVINRKITGLERTELLRAITQKRSLYI